MQGLVFPGHYVDTCGLSKQIYANAYYIALFIQILQIFYTAGLQLYSKRDSGQQACNFIQKETLAQVFFCEFCEISKNTTGQLLLYFVFLKHPCIVSWNQDYQKLEQCAEFWKKSVRESSAASDHACIIFMSMWKTFIFIWNLDLVQKRLTIVRIFLSISKFRDKFLYFYQEQLSNSFLLNVDIHSF